MHRLVTNQYYCNNETNEYNIIKTGVDDGVDRAAAAIWRRPMRQNDIRRRVNDTLDSVLDSVSLHD